jgi:dynein intermediate chain 2
MLFKDDSAVQKRAVSEISWYPEGPQKLAVAYSVQRFQQMHEKMPTQAYIWDVNNPNSYDQELKCPSSVTKI